ncbi:sodium:solute symporter family protein [Arenicella xantha]|uniref:Na+/proline symporter n=1 Tax=Arenicella xantha TaxID=644221 RepID=A0A395JJ98_9GAMM|nr:sodium:solute symporter family protein [Arenicella xantha]RBP50863.1 Na+/proline symporter [Arenicella xantha]
MQLSMLDFSIIVAYLLATVVIGLVLKKRAERSKKDYMLGGNKLPWYMLGLSNASGMFDISGTMWLVTLLFVYGLKSAWIPWLWPVFNQIFLMVFLSMWLRRSNVSTGAEWIGTRFGHGTGAQLSHTVIVVFAILLGLGYLAYGFIGVGKFVEIFLPWEVVSAYLPFSVSPQYVPHFYGVVLTCFAVFYSVLGGMMSIVWADVIQFVLMAIAAIVIGVIAMNALGDQSLLVPDGWLTPFFGTSSSLDWGRIIPEVNDKIVSDNFGIFHIFFMMMIFKGVLVSMAGPAPNYDMQKILSTKSPREAALMSGSVSLILMPLRYFMIAGFGVLAVLNFDKLDLMVNGQIDFEQILPSAINEFVPSGVLGLLLAGLLAAFMSTFAGTLNATQAYLVNDIYLKHINPEANAKTITRINWSAGLLMVSVSIVLGFFAGNVNNILQWIVSGLYGSYVAANVLKWYWWRFNGTGFFWGMVGGLVPALTFRYIFEGVFDLYTFPLMLLLAVIGCIAGTLLTKPVDDETLKAFYKNVKPWGFWGPIRDKVMAEDPSFAPNDNFKRDAFNVFIGVIWQTSLVILPIFIVLKSGLPLVVTAGIAIVSTIVLKKTWFDRLPQDVVKGA